MVPGKNFAFSMVEEKPHLHKAVVTIGHEHIDALYNEALLAKKLQTDTYGFTKGSTPIHYIEHNFRSNIVEHLKELLFTHCVVHYLYESLAQNKVVLAGDPDLIDISLRPDGDAQYTFSLFNIPIDSDQRWKRLHVKQALRKNYKDLDRQVDAMIKEELELKKRHADSTIALGDWVYFDIAIVDKNNKILLHDYKSSLWIRMNSGEDDKALHDLFLGKKTGDSFLTQSNYLQEYLSLASDMNYTFQVDIKAYLVDAFFSLDLLKRHFKLRNDREVHLKIIEVFSTRNDTSQRRETVDAVFRLLCKQYFIGLPTTLLERQRVMVLSALQTTSDYHVYKAQSDFREIVKNLAEKQLKENIIIDAIAIQEGIEVTHEDVLGYLNLLKRPRLKEFIYFKLPSHKVLGQDVPLSDEFVKRYCLREKTLNHIISHVTRKVKES